MQVSQQDNLNLATNEVESTHITAELAINSVESVPLFLQNSLKASGRESFLTFVQRVILELKSTKFALASFVVNNLRRRYRRSVLGFAWSLLNPLITMAVMTTVFAMLFKHDPRSFAIFVFTGLLPWTFFCDAITSGSQAIIASEAFLKKVYIPKMFFPLVAVATEGVNFTLSLASLMFIGLFLGMKISLGLLLLPVAIALISLFTFSLALILAVTTVYFRDLTHIIRVVLGAMFYVIPIIYPVEQVPIQYRWGLYVDPIYYFLQLFRILIYDGRLPALIDWVIPTVITAAVLMMALYVLMKKEKDLIFRL